MFEKRNHDEHDERLDCRYLEVFDGLLEVDAPQYGTQGFDTACEGLRFDVGLLDDADLWRAFEHVRSLRQQAPAAEDHAEAITLSVVLERFTDGGRLAEAIELAAEREDRETDALIERGDQDPEFADTFPEEWEG